MNNFEQKLKQMQRLVSEWQARKDGQPSDSLSLSKRQRAGIIAIAKKAAKKMADERVEYIPQVLTRADRDMFVQSLPEEFQVEAEQIWNEEVERNDAEKDNFLSHDAPKLMAVAHGVTHGENVFAVMGNTMTIKYDEKATSLSIKNNLGLLYIREIIKNGCSDDGLTPMELMQRAGLPPIASANDTITTGSLLDATTTTGDRNEIDKADQREENAGLDMPEVKAQLWEKQQELTGAVKDGDKKEAETLRKMFRNIGIIEVVRAADGQISYKRRTNRHSGKVPIDKTKEKMRTAVAQRIIAAKREINKRLPSLHRHLEASMKSRRLKWQYSPDPAVKWIT